MGPAVAILVQIDSFSRQAAPAVIAAWSSRGTAGIRSTYQRATRPNANVTCRCATGATS
jgi:hypothetical protein